MSGTGNNQASIQSPALALRNIGLSSRDLMAAINRLGTGMNPVGLVSLDLVTATSKRKITSKEHILDAFTCFRELPSEIRIKIWNHASHLPRNVDIYTKNLGSIRVGVDTQFDSYKFFSHFSSPPAVLHTCRESREEGLKHYQLEFGTSHYFPFLEISTPPRIYVNFACDRLCLLKPYCFGSDIEVQSQTFVEVCRKHGARYLAINVEGDSHWPLADITTSWNALKGILLFGYRDYRMNDHQAGVPIDFIKSQHLRLYSSSLKSRESQRLIDEEAIRQLEIARRDFLTLFEMHRDGLGIDNIDESEIISGSKEKLMWRAPAIEISHIVVGGKRDVNDWAWPYLMGSGVLD